VELLRAVLDAFGRRDVDAFLPLVDPEVDFVALTGLVEGGGYHGHDGVKRWRDDVVSVFPDLDVEIEDARPIGDLVLAALRVHGHGADSRVPFERKVWLLSEWRHDKVVWWRVFQSEAEALEAGGLSDSPRGESN
jgi:hypothetical protein